jgi:hypothetical protein
MLSIGGFFDQTWDSAQANWLCSYGSVTGSNPPEAALREQLCSSPTTARIFAVRGVVKRLVGLACLDLGEVF